MCYEKRGLRGTEKGAKGTKSLQMKKIGEIESKVSASAELPRVRAFLASERATVNVWKARSSDWLILQLLMKIFNIGWGKGQQIWQLPPGMQKPVRTEPDLPSAIIQILYGIEWKTFEVWKKKEKLGESGSRSTGVKWGNLFCCWLSQKQAVLESSWESLCLYDSSLTPTRKRGQKFIQSLASTWTFQCWAELNL